MEGAEKKKLALASDLHWLISEGHVIEFNDGALDLARSKSPAPARAGGSNGGVEMPVPPDKTSSAAATASPADAEATAPEKTITVLSEHRAESANPEGVGEIPAAD